jgi:hypothetical protein
MSFQDTSKFKAGFADDADDADVSEASKLITSVPGGRGYEDRVEHAVQAALNDRDAKIGRMEAENERLRNALREIADASGKLERSDNPEFVCEIAREALK